MVLRLLRARRLDRRLDPARPVPEPRRAPGTTPSCAGRTGPTVAVVDHEVPLPEAAVAGDPQRTACGPSTSARTRSSAGSSPTRRQGVAVDDPAELYRPGGGRGDLVPMGLDLEWETDGEPYHYGARRPATRSPASCTARCCSATSASSSTASASATTPGASATGGSSAGCGRRGGSTTAPASTAPTSASPTCVSASATCSRRTAASWPAAWPDATGGGVVRRGGARRRGLPDGGDGDDRRARAHDAAARLRPGAARRPRGPGRPLPRAMCRFATPDGRTGLGWTEWNQPGAEMTELRRRTCERPTSSRLFAQTTRASTSHVRGPASSRAIAQTIAVASATRMAAPTSSTSRRFVAPSAPSCHAGRSPGACGRPPVTRPRARSGWRR